jgi:hypothetical protein
MGRLGGEGKKRNNWGGEKKVEKSQNVEKHLWLACGAVEEELVGGG